MTAIVTPPPTVTPPDAPRSLGAQAGRAAFWNTALLPAKLGSHLAAQLVLANTLPPAAYGVYVLALAVSSTSGAFVDLGTERSVVKFLPEVAGREGKRGVGKLIGWVFGLKMVILGPVLVTAVFLHNTFFRYLDSRVPADAPTVAEIVTREHWTIFGAVIAFVLIGAFYDVAMQSLVATFRNRSWNLVQISVQVIEPTVIVAIVLLGGSIVQILMGRVVVELFALVGAAIVAIIAVRRAPHEERATVTKEERGVPMPARRFAQYSFLQYALQVAAFAQSYAFASIILRNSVEIAGYRVAAGSVSAVLPALLVPITGMQVPLFTRLFSRRDEAGLATAYAMIARFLALVLVPGMAGMALLVPNLFKLLYPQYVAVAPICVILVVLGFTESLFTTGTTAMLTFERYRPVILKSLISLCAIPTLFYTVPTFGPIGAAITSGSFAVTAALFGTVMSNRLLPIRYPVAFLGRVALATLPMALLVGVLANTVGRVPDDVRGVAARLPYLAVTGVIALLGALVFVVAFRLLGGMDRSDVERLRTVRIPLVGLAVRLLAGRSA